MADEAAYDETEASYWGGHPIDALAQHLHWQMARMDSSPEEWASLTQSDRDFYRNAVGSLFDRMDLVEAALASWRSGDRR